MRRWGTLGLCAVLAFVAVAAIALQGAPLFTGPRWAPPWESRPALPGQQAPTPITDTPAPRRPDRILNIDVSWLVVAVAVIVLVVVAALVWRAIRRRLDTPERDATASLGPVEGPEETGAEEPHPAPVRRGLDRALDALSEQREPRDAIERAWLGLEEGAANSGVRRLPAETPGEFVARVIARVAADRVAARTLLEVYLHARFGSDGVTGSEVDAARSALRALQASWAVPSRSGGAR